MVQWLRLRNSTAGGAGLIPGRGTKVPHAMQCGKEKKKIIWSIIYLQRHVSFRCTAKWFSYTYIYAYIYSFQILFSYRLLQNIEYSSLNFFLERDSSYLNHPSPKPTTILKKAITILGSSMSNIHKCWLNNFSSHRRHQEMHVASTIPPLPFFFPSLGIYCVASLC